MDPHSIVIICILCQKRRRICHKEGHSAVLCSKPLMFLKVRLWWNHLIEVCIHDLCELDDENEQYGVSLAAKCDIGVGQVKKKLAVLSLDPETKGYVLEFINIREDISVVGVDFCKSNNFILLCTENK